MNNKVCKICGGDTGVRINLCQKCYAKEWRKNNKDKIKVYLEQSRDHRKQWKKDNIKKIRKWKKNWNDKNIHKRKAHNMADYSVNIPKNHLCEICNKNLAIERHHPDYNKPLEVMLLCSSCHKNLHVDIRKRNHAVFLGESVHSPTSSEESIENKISDSDVPFALPVDYKLGLDEKEKEVVEK